MGEKRGKPVNQLMLKTFQPCKAAKKRLKILLMKKTFYPVGTEAEKSNSKDNHLIDGRW